MSTTFEESCNNYSITDEKAKEQFKAVCEFTASQPARCSNAAPELGVVFTLKGVPEKLCINPTAPEADRKYCVKFPVLTADGSELGISLSRLQGHYSKLKVWKSGVKDVEVASNAADYGVSAEVKDGKTVFAFADNQMLVLSNNPREAVEELMSMQGQKFVIVATFTAGEFKTKHSLIAKHMT